MDHSARTRGNPGGWTRFFHGLFYGRAKFCCKTMQRYEMQRKSDSFRLSMKNKLCNAGKTYATR